MTKWISRASVMRIIDADPVYSDVINEKTYMASQISNLPTKEETSRPHGEWIAQDEFEAYFKCSNCGIVIDNDFPIWRNFCPNCGADMRKEGEAE